MTDAGQPWRGLGGLLLATVVFLALATGTGSTATSLLILGPMSAFALPLVAVVAFWWNDWPGSRLTTPWTGLIDTVLVAAAAVVLTIAGQAVVERSDIRGVFEATPGPGVPVTFPATLVLAGAVFTALLQLLLVCERWPLSRLELRWSGLAALVLSWAAGTAATSASSTSTPCQPPTGPPSACETLAAPSPPRTSALRSSRSACGRRCCSSPCAAGPSVPSPAARAGC
jgi:hypothetical protein